MTRIDSMHPAAPDQGGWYVYMVHCRDGSLYTGIARDVARRVDQHNDSPRAAKYTRARRPVTLVYCEPASSRAAAAMREAVIKKLSAGEKAALARRRFNQAPEYCEAMGIPRRVISKLKGVEVGCVAKSRGIQS